MEKQKIRHLDLFSGIGGFALAIDRVFGESEHIFCDNDKFCQAVLKKHWPQSKIYGDIRDIRLDTNTNSDRRTGGNQEINSTDVELKTLYDLKKCDLLTGGFPCQPFSQAGRRKGTEDDRFLWPEMLRVIREFSPLWVIAENVRGILTINGGMVFEQVCLDLEGAGYEVQPFLIPAVAINAPHRRDRVWFVGYSNSRRGIGRDEDRTDKVRKMDNNEYTGNISNAPDTTIIGCNQREQGDNRPGEDESPDRLATQSWQRNWIEVATELCGMDDGLPAELDGLKLSASGHRKERLKSLGNSIVPQVAEEILKAIKKTYGTKTCLPSLQPRN